MSDDWKIRFGTAGTSDSFAAQGYKTSLEVPEYTAKMGLNAFEYQCGRGVRLGLDKAAKMAALAAPKDILFSVHAPYYISMSSLEEDKRLNSIQYLLQSAAVCRALGGKRIIFHSGSCGKQSREAALEKALDTMRRAVEALDEAGFADMTLCPETMGKVGQLGTLDEVLALCGVDERITPCIDFGHLNARTLGGIQSKVPSEKPQQLNFFEEKLLEPQAKAEHKIIGQVFDTYWLVEFHDNLYIIDQHAAHERVLYEQTLKGMKTREFTSQLISPPIILNLSMQEAELLRLYMDQFTRIGFEIEEFGQDSYAVRAVPDNLFSIAKKELLMEMIDSLSDEINRNAPSNLIDEKIASMSCKAAVKGNMRLSAAEVDTLITELLSLDNPYHCPHGRPTIIAMSRRELEKKFKRIV